MKKFIQLMAILLTATVLLAGCSPATSPETEPVEYEQPEEQEEQKEQEVKMVDFEAWDRPENFPEEITDEMLETIQSLKKQRGYHILNTQNINTGQDLFILITAGEKPTGGYSLAVKEMSVKNDTLEIIVEEKEPAKEDTVIQVLTYPLTLLKTKAGEFGFFSVTDTKGRAFEPVSPGQPVLQDGDAAEKEGMILGARGTLVGRIDSNSVEIEIDGEYKAFTLAEQNVAGSIADGENIIFDYYEDQHGRVIVNRMEKDR